MIIDLELLSKDTPKHNLKFSFETTGPYKAGHINVRLMEAATQKEKSFQKESGLRRGQDYSLDEVIYAVVHMYDDPRNNILTLNGYDLRIRKRK